MGQSENSLKSQTFIAKTISGLEEVLASELIALGAANVQLLKRAVSFEGDIRFMYKANYCLRTAQRILMPVYSFELANEDDLYQHVYDFPWEQYLSLQKTLAVDAVVTDSELTHSHYVALRTKDAIVDRFRSLNNGRRPSVDIENPDVRINIHINGNTCDVSLDSSGASLHKRGYRVSNAEAPISEVLAAGLIMLSGWNRDSHFIDPMCGSGTLLIEAAMYANNFPAGMYRKDFGFMHWPDFDSMLWDEVNKEALQEQTEFEYQIIGSDISPKNLAAARANLKSARLHKDIRIFVSPMEALQAPPGKPGIVIINPPYGERIRLNDIIGLYKSIGNTLKSAFSGYQAWVISSDQKALSFIGLRPSRKLTVFNGQLECRYVNFDLYKGSKRGRYMDNEPENEHSADNHISTYTPTEPGDYEHKQERPPFREYKSREYRPGENKSGDDNRERNTGRRDRPFQDDSFRKKEKPGSDDEFKPAAKPVTRIEERGEHEPFWKGVVKKEPESKLPDDNSASTQEPQKQAEERIPSKGSRFSSRKDYVITRKTELRPRKQKTDIEKKELKQTRPAKPKPPVNYDDLED